MERDLRDYSIKRSPATLKAYRLAEASVPKQTARLRFLVRGNPSQERRASNISALATQVAAILHAYLSATLSGHQRQAEAAVNSARVRRISDDWVAQTTAFSQSEAQLKVASWDRSRADSRTLDWALGISASAGFLLTLFATWKFGLRIAQRLEHLGAIARRVESGGQLDPRIEGNDEITDLERAYHCMAVEIRKRETQLEKYRLLSEQARDIILFVRRSDTRILEANAAAARAYGYSREELATLNVRMLRTEDASSQLDSDLDRAEHTPVTYETVHRRRDGSTFPVEVAAQSAVVGGESVIVGIIRDITERRDAEAQLRAALNRAVEASLLKSQFVATMSHEIRTPMNAVIGMTELLLESPLSEEQRHFAKVVQDSGALLLSLVNDILDFSKIEAGRVDLELMGFSLLEIIESIASFFIAQASEKQLVLMTYVDPSIPDSLVGDPGRLRQVLVNIVANAVKFTHRGAVVLSADLLHRNEHTAAVAFAVKDTGIGIAPDAIAALFEPFRQADGSTSRKYGGTGLGLSISKGLVELMGGTITVESSAGTGSTFSFALEFEYAKSEATRSSRIDGSRALVVDDDPIALQIFTRYLTSWRMRVGTACDAGTAAEMLRKAAEEGDPYEVAIIDLAMPELNGFELGRQVRAEPRLAQTRMIMVTAYDKPGQGPQAIADGFSAYLTKPVRQSQLFDSISNTNSGPPIPLKTMSCPPDGSPVRGHILVAEDNAVNRDLALLQLRRLGYTAETVADGREAVAAVLQGHFTAVLMDCQMPNMDGYEATRAIRKAESRTGKHIRIIAMTANSLAEDRTACLTAGMDDYVPKPVMIDDLRDLLADGQPVKNSAASAGHVPALQVERLTDLFNGQHSDMCHFLQKALSSLHDTIERLQASNTLEARLSVAHTLKGAAASIGAVELAEIVAEFEEALLTGNADHRTYEIRVFEAYDRLTAESQHLYETLGHGV